MISKTVTTISRSAGGIFHAGVERVRGLSWREVRDLIRFAGRRLQEEKLPQVAGSLTFTSTLALVPLLTIMLAVFTSFPMFTDLRSALDTWFVQTGMPKAVVYTIVSNLTQFASAATRLSAVGAVALLVTSAAMMGMIERAFNQVWRVRRPRPLVQRVMIFWALITLGPLLFGLSLTVTSQVFTATSSLARSIPLLGGLFYTLLSVALTTGAYTLLYMTVPNRSVHWRDAVWGALAAAIAFEVAKRVFAIFIRQFPAYAIIYGALAALPLFLIWIYLSWLITLVGAVLAAALPIVKHERWWYQPAPGAAFVDAMAILKVLHGATQLTGSALVSRMEIRRHTRIGYDEISALLEQMVAAGWVGSVQDEAAGRTAWGKRKSHENWVLLVDPARLKLADVYRMFVFASAGADGGTVAAEGVPATPLAVDTVTLARQVEAAIEKGLDQSLAQHFAGDTAPLQP